MGWGEMGWEDGVGWDGMRWGGTRTMGGGMENGMGWNGKEWNKKRRDARWVGTERSTCRLAVCGYEMSMSSLLPPTRER